MHEDLPFEVVLALQNTVSPEEAKTVFDVYGNELNGYVFALSIAGEREMPWSSSEDLPGGSFVRSVFAHERIFFVSHEIISALSNLSDRIEIPIDYSIGLDVNVAQYLRRVIEGCGGSTHVAFRESLRCLARRRFNWEILPYRVHRL